jgi:hypothetical protein
MLFDDIEDTEKGPFCKPYGQLFFDNLEKLPSFQVIEAYLTCLMEAQENIQRAISILEGALKKGKERLKEVGEPADLQFIFGKIVGSRGKIEEEIERLTKNRRQIDDLIATYSDQGILCVTLKDFMTAFDADYKIVVEKKKMDSDELYLTDIKVTDLPGCAGFDHLNKVLTGYLLRKVMKTEGKKQ